MLDLRTQLLILNILDLAVWVFPHVALIRKPSRSGSEFVEAVPQLAWIRWVYPLLFYSCILSGTPGIVILGSPVGDHGSNAVPYVLGILLSALAVFDGLFALLTGVYVYPAFAPLRVRVIADETAPIRRIAVLQSTFGLFFLVLTFLGSLLYAAAVS